MSPTPRPAPKISSPRHPVLVYTCAGPHSNVPRWLEGGAGFDLWVNDYGPPAKHRHLADHHTSRPGKKFPNLLHFHRRFPELLAAYDAVFVADDDLVLDGAGISRLFALQKEYDLWLLQPAFSPSGVVSHVGTEVQPGCVLRWTNFVEVTAPLFRRDQLAGFLEVYDPRVLGWGIDWCYLDFLGPHLRGKVAIIDAVPCINPHPESKAPRAETEAPALAHLHRDRQREAWEAYRDRHRMRREAEPFQVYGYEWEPWCDTWWKRLWARGLRRPLRDKLWILARDLRFRLHALLGRGPRA